MAAYFAAFRRLQIIGHAISMPDTPLAAFHMFVFTLLSFARWLLSRFLSVEAARVAEYIRPRYKLIAVFFLR